MSNRETGLFSLPPRLSVRKTLGAWDSKILLAACMYAEARGEGSVGMRAVGHVVMNRANRRQTFAKTEILRAKQFSWVDVSDPNFWAVLSLLGAGFGAAAGLPPQWVQALRFAGMLLKGTGPADPTNGADHYANLPLIRKQRDGKLPRWITRALKRGEDTCVIGHHTFFRIDG